MTSALTAAPFRTPLAAPAPQGLFSAVTWQEESEALRWLVSGIQFEVWNYDVDAQFGVWDAPWCAAEADLTSGDRKEPGDRPEWPPFFLPMTTWAADKCSPRPEDRAEVRTRVQQVHRLKEPNEVEKHLAPRLLAGAEDTADDLVGALGHLEGLLAETNTVGVIHASATWAASAAQANLVRWTGGKMLTPMGHQWVFGGGYVGALQDTLVATSPVFGWRGQVHTKEEPYGRLNEFRAVAERSLLVGFEALVGAVDVTG